MKRSNRKKPKVRQTTLTQFSTLPSSLRRSTRGTTTLVALEDPSTPILPAKTTTKKEKAKQLKLKVEKKPSLVHNTAILSPSRQQPPKSPNFAVVIITSPEKRRLLSQQTPKHIGWFPPPNQDQSQDTKLPLNDKGKREEVTSQDNGTSDSEDMGPILASARKRRAGTKARTTGKAAQDGNDKVLAGGSKKGSKKNHVSLDSSDEDTCITSSTPKKRLWVSIPSQKGDSDPAPKRIRHAKNNKKPTPQRTEGNEDGDDDDDDDDDAHIGSTRKRMGVVKGKGRQLDQFLNTDVEDEEKEDLEEDLAFMASKRNILPSRTRYNGSSPKKTPYQRKLDELRAKRAGKAIQASTSDDDQPKRALYDTDPEDNSSGHEGEGEDNEDNRCPSGNYSSDNDSWIVEDDGGIIGAPDSDAQIPIEFTSLSHQSTRENFKIVCLWIVQSILNPLFPLDDELSVFALRALERRIDSYGGSVLQSSVWKAPFMRALRARPTFDSEPCDERQICDACHISGRTATYAVTITGSRYDPSTLEDLEGSEDDSEDSAGLEIPAAETIFYLGRHCHARAQMSHAFIHWKKQLRDAIETILDQKEYFSPYWASKSAKMDAGERTRWASRVTDDLGDHIKEFYHDLKRGLEDAQTNMTTQRFKKWR